MYKKDIKTNILECQRKSLSLRRFKQYKTKLNN